MTLNIIILAYFALVFPNLVFSFCICIPVFIFTFTFLLFTLKWAFPCGSLLLFLSFAATNANTKYIYNLYLIPPLEGGEAVYSLLQLTRIQNTSFRLCERSEAVCVQKSNTLSSTFFTNVFSSSF